MLHPVILSGGSGTRLWPLSRTAFPKQLLPLLSEQSLLQETLLRLRNLKIAEGVASPIAVCNQEHRFLVAEQLQNIGVKPASLVLEPCGRNTAPAIALAALLVQKSDPDGLMLVLPADHIIRDIAAFHRAIADAVQSAQQGFLTTFGIVPDKPETGYGYIQRGEAVESGFSRVARFVEKPAAATAQAFLESGDYYWNSGMFLFPATLFLEELEKQAPAVLEASRKALEGAHRDLDFLRPDADSFIQSPAISIDYAVMEKTDRAAVVPVEMGWSDVGSYAALWEADAKDAEGNAGKGEIAFLDAQNCYVHSEKQLVACLGVEDLVVVATADAILITTKDRSQDVKQIVDRLRQEGRTEHEIHRKVYRPWGSYEGVERGERFQVKQLIVKPGQKSSMQVHHHRSEHWVVVKGTAEVTLGDEKRLVSEDQSIYIPLGIPHRIFNPGRIPMHFIEVQSGSYLEEDDIVRLDDEYGRG